MSKSQVFKIIEPAVFGALESVAPPRDIEDKFMAASYLSRAAMENLKGPIGASGLSTEVIQAYVDPIFDNCLTVAGWMDGVRSSETGSVDGDTHYQVMKASYQAPVKIASIPAHEQTAVIEQLATGGLPMLLDRETGLYRFAEEAGKAIESVQIPGRVCPGVGMLYGDSGTSIVRAFWYQYADWWTTLERESADAGS